MLKERSYCLLCLAITHSFLHAASQYFKEKCHVPPFENHIFYASVCLYSYSHLRTCWSEDSGGSVLPSHPVDLRLTSVRPDCSAFVLASPPDSALQWLPVLGDPVQAPFLVGKPLIYPCLSGHSVSFLIHPTEPWPPFLNHHQLLGLSSLTGMLSIGLCPMLRDSAKDGLSLSTIQ